MYTNTELMALLQDIDVARRDEEAAHRAYLEAVRKENPADIITLGRAPRYRDAAKEATEHRVKLEGKLRRLLEGVL